MSQATSATPLLGFCAYSGTGKTTLLTQLIPILSEEGIRLSVIKHAHHNFDIDHQGKDSYELRHAGATQMLISSSKRWALMRELDTGEEELSLTTLIATLDHSCTDLILVEGFKKEAIPKIELYRPSLGHSLMCDHDSNVIAVATDEPCPIPEHINCLNLNQPNEIAHFIKQHFQLS